MKKLFLSLLIFFTLWGCTLTPLAFDNDARSQKVNTTLVCAEKIDLYPLSINGANPPQEAFNHYLKKLKEYTTNNIIVHETMKVAMEEEKINNFVKNYGDGTLHIYDLSEKNRDKFLQFTKQIKETKDSIVMIYTPKLFYNTEEKRRVNGQFFSHSHHPHIMAFNPLNINDSAVISDIQAWKIVFMQILGYTLGVPANSDHNKAGNCTRRECVMYPKPDWRAIMSVLLLNGMPYDFCHKCKAELKEAKKRCDVVAQNIQTVDKNTPRQELTHSKDWITAWNSCRGYVALKKDGSLWQFGKVGGCDWGQILLPEEKKVSTYYLQPKKIGEGFDNAQIINGGYRFYAIKKDGTLWGWGEGLTSEPIPLSDDQDWIDFGIKWAGNGCCNFDIGLKKDGSLWRLPEFFNSSQTQKLPILKPIAREKSWDKIILGCCSIYGLAKDGSLWYSFKEENKTVFKEFTEQNEHLEKFSDITSAIATMPSKKIQSEFSNPSNIETKEDGTLWLLPLTSYE